MRQTFLIASSESEVRELRDLFLQHALRYYSLVFDAVYTPKITRLLREAEESGAVTVSGLEMFIGQAYEQFERFTGLPGKINIYSLYVLACSLNIFGTFEDLSDLFIVSFPSCSTKGTLSENYVKILVVF